MKPELATRLAVIVSVAGTLIAVAISILEN